MKEYNSPELEIIEFDSEDVITASSAGQSVGGAGGEEEF